MTGIRNDMGNTWVYKMTWAIDTSIQKPLISLLNNLNYLLYVVCTCVFFFLGAASFTDDLVFGVVSRPFTFANVRCTSSESKLTLCPHSEQISDCASGSFAFVQCQTCKYMYI